MQPESQTNELISVIMPAYNAGKYIRQAIESVQAQTYVDWELIIVDDGSIDNTAAIIKDFVKNDSRIIYLYQERGRQGKARNLAIKHSKGDYVAFLDADDMWENVKLQIQIGIMNKQKDIDLLFTGGWGLLNDGKTFDFDIQAKKWTWNNDANAFILQNQIPILSVLSRKKAIVEAGFFSEKVELQNTEDYHLWLKLLKHGDFLSIENKLFYYRVHNEQSTVTANVEKATLYCFDDLVQTGVISKENKHLLNRLRWSIFRVSDFSFCLKMLYEIFTHKKWLRVIAYLDRIFPNNALLKKVTFHLIYLI